MTTIAAEEQTIDPDIFVNRMEGHWTETLENVSSAALRLTWRQLGEAFNKNILQEPDNPFSIDRNDWDILSPPTGSGKSQGAMIFCSLLSYLDFMQHPGTLIVTRLIEDCEKMAEEINHYGNPDRHTAIAFHSKQDKVQMSELYMYPVIVITHRAYELALDYLGAGAGIADTFKLFHEYLSPKRKRRLVIIDEALDVVEHNKCTLDGLRATAGVISAKLRDQFPNEIKAIEHVISILDEYHSSQGKQPDQIYSKKPLALTNKALPDLTAFRKAFSEKFTGVFTLMKKDPKTLEAVRKQHDVRLRGLNALFRSWQYYSKVESKDALNTARLLVPEDVKGAVVMDATAMSNVVYQVFDKAKVIKPPEGTRNYKNVTLHVSKGHKVGKRFMESHTKKLCNELMVELEKTIKPSQSCLIVTHKGVSPHLDTYTPSFHKDVTHWGRTTGSNQWKDFDTCVIFGIPYRPPTWPINTYFACKGIASDKWLQNEEARKYNGHKDIKASLATGQLVVDIVQAINRIGCRKTIDSNGNCPESHVYIMLPDNEQATEIINGVRREMPGIKVESWNYTVQEGKQKRSRRSNYESGLLTFLEGMEKGDSLAVNHIRNLIGMSPRTLKTLTEKINNPDSRLYEQVEELGIKYEVIQQGKVRKAYLSKS